MAVVIMEKTIEDKRAELILDMPHVIVRYDGCVISDVAGAAWDNIKDMEEVYLDFEVGAHLERERNRAYDALFDA